MSKKYLIDEFTKSTEFITGYSDGTTFGLRDIPELNMYNNFHIGNDYNTPKGTALYAIEDGYFLRTVRDGYGDGYGNYILFYVPKFNKTFHLAHLAHIEWLEDVKLIKKGTYIGNTGNTGQSTGAHLHLGVAVGKKYDTIKNGWENPSNFDFSVYEGSKPQSTIDRTGKNLVIYPQWLIGEKYVPLVTRSGQQYERGINLNDGVTRSYKIIEQVNDGFYKVHVPNADTSETYIQWKIGIGFE